MKVFSYTDPREAVLNYKGLLLGREGSWQPAVIVEGQRHSKTVIVHFDGVDDRDQAAALVGVELGIDRDALPAPEEGQFYWSDLVGLKVVHRDGTSTGKELGKIDSMLETGANDVMVVSGETDRLIPFAMNDVVLAVDLQQKRVEVDWEWD